MNVILQAYIGAIPLFIGLIIYLIKKKKYLVPAILFGIQIIFCSFMIGLHAPKSIGDVEAIGIYEGYKSMASGEFNQALDAINEAFVNAADKCEITLAKARLYVLRGSWEEAVALYEKVMEQQKGLLEDEELEFVRGIKNGVILTAEQMSYQATNIHYLKEQGVNPVDFGFSDISDEQIADNIDYLNNYQSNIVPNLIKEEVAELEEEYEVLSEIDVIGKVVDTVMSNSYNSYTGMSVENADDLYTKFTLEELNALLVEYKDKYPQLFEENKYLEAYILSEAMAGNKLDDILLEGSSKEYEIISNMYLSGILTEDNFTKDFSETYKDEYKEVLAKCQEIADELSKTEDINKVYVDGESLAEVVDKLSSQENFALQQMAQDMNDLVEEEEVGEDKLAELFLTMSAVAEQIGNSEEAKEFFNEAVSHSSVSSDRGLSQVLGTIQEAYTEGGDDLDYIDIAEDVADVYENNFHYDIVSEKVTDDIKGVTGSAVSETLARVSIGRIDVSRFPEISVSIQYSGETEMSEDIVEITDCGIGVEDFTIRKQQYDGSKVLLLCDVSGSMRGSIEQLQDAVMRYVKSMEPDEQVNIVLFSDKIDAESGFSTNKDELLKFAESEIYVRGGTMICESTYICLEQFANNNVANTLIVMTDGEDNSPYSAADMESKIGSRAEQNNVTIYTIGLGSAIIQSFLVDLADVGGGKFLYCSNDSELESAYKFIHGRINNEYVITFEAEDLDSQSRLFEIEIDDGKIQTPAKDSKNYTLGNDATEEESDVEFATKLPAGVVIDGLDVNQIAKSDERQLVKILGSGFDSVNITNVYLESTNGQSNCKIKEIKDDSITFQVAPSVSEGTYSVFVTMDGKKYKADRLVIGNPNTDEVVFGAYHFTADTIEIYEDETVLSGNVVLNDYLYFDGEVTLKGNINKDSSVSMSTGRPAYVHHDTASYTGLDKIILSKQTKTKAFDSISVNIYDDGLHYNDYETYKVEMPWTSEIGVVELGIVSLEENTVYVYPDRVEIISSVGVLKDNTITDLLTNGVDFFKIPDGMPYLKGEMETKSRLMKMGPFAYFNMDIEAGVEESELKIADFLSLEGKIAAKLMYDTYNREFEIGLTVEAEDSSKLSGSGTEVKKSGDAGITMSIVGEGDDRRNSDKFFNLEVALPLELTFYVEGVPVTIKDIKCSLENYNITQAIQNLTGGSAFTSTIKQYLANKEGADLKVSGSVALVSTAALPDKVSSVIKKWLGDDVDLIALDDLYGSVGINYPHLAAGATVNVLGCVEIASIDMEFGAIGYADYIGELLNASDGKKHYGFTFTSGKGIKFDWDAVGANVTGNMSATVTVDRFLVSSYVSGIIAANADVNLFGTGFKVDGEAKTEACAAVWVDNSKWNAAATIVASVDGTANLKIFGVNILEKEVHEKCVILDEQF